MYKEFFPENNKSFFEIFEGLYLLNPLVKSHLTYYMISAKKHLYIFSFAHIGDGKTLALLTNVTDYHYHFRQTGVLDRCTGLVY